VTDGVFAISHGKKGRGRNKFSFRYSKEQWKGKLYARPRVEAVLRAGDREFRTLMLIDSGADVSFIPAAVADILKLDLSEEVTRSRGVSGWFETRSGECEVSLVARRGVLELGKIPVIVPVVDLDEEEGTSLDYCLLGRDPLFTRYNIHFKQRSRLIVAKKARYD
jgi:hypothetical protein